MNRVTVSLDTKGGTRASEILADLRVVAETLYFPMKVVGFWDERADVHLCPEENRREECPHRHPPSDPRYADYGAALQRQLQVSLEVAFPHAGIKVYLS